MNAPGILGVVFHFHFQSASACLITVPLAIATFEIASKHLKLSEMASFVRGSIPFYLRVPSLTGTGLDHERAGALLLLNDQ